MTSVTPITRPETQADTLYLAETKMG